MGPSDRRVCRRSILAAMVLMENDRARLEQRARDIDALPTVEWKGRTLYTLKCDGPWPHLVHVPEHQLWHLIDLRAFRCPFHA